MDAIVVYGFIIILGIVLVLGGVAKKRTSLQFSLLGIGIILTGISLIEVVWGGHVVFLGLICLIIGFVKKESSDQTK